jgi:hypothetical protein
VIAEERRRPGGWSAGLWPAAGIRGMRLLPFILLLAACASMPSSDAVNRVIDDWHQAASVADENTYFGHMSPDAVFLGTDATERWELTSFSRVRTSVLCRGESVDIRAAQPERHDLAGRTHRVVRRVARQRVVR